MEVFSIYILNVTSQESKAIKTDYPKQIVLLEAFQSYLSGMELFKQQIIH